MPRKKNGELPLPAEWEMDSDFDGRPFFINHSAQLTTWVDPRDRFTKPHTFADCVGDELPYGWEHAMEAHVGSYYINHLQHTTQVEDPRLQWRSEQEEMLRSYVGHAQNDLAAKKEIYRVKQERLVIAQEEVQSLNRTVASQWTTSRTSLNSTCSTKYDPDLLKADVALARNRVSRLNHEVAQAHAEVKFSEQGLRTLQSIDEKMTQHENPNMYSMEQAQQILTRIRANQQSISASYQHKKHLLQSLAKLRSPSIKGLLESSPLTSEEKLSTASQTDLSWEPHTNPEQHLGDIVRMQLQYDEAFKQVSRLQMQLASVENQIDPTHAESDKDRLLLIQEKDQLLRELRGISLKGRSEAEMEDLQSRIHQLEFDLTQAMQVSNQQIAQRLKLNESKTEILQKLSEATQITTYLESHIRSLSMSSLSVSSGSSRGSLGSLSTGSKGSLNSLSISDIYAASTMQPDVNLLELHRRVEQLLQGHVAPPPTTPAGSKESLARSQSTKSLSPVSSLSSLSPPVSPYEAAPPPSYAQHIQKHWQQPGKSVSPIQEIEGELAHMSIDEGAQSVNSRPSVSAAVSDESVAGDSGVFEAAYKKTTSGENPTCIESAQIQVKLKYEGVEGHLLIGIEQARNLNSLALPSQTCQVCIKASLVPSQQPQSLTFCTKALKELQSPKFIETFSVPIAENKLASKTLQLYVWCLESTQNAQYCLGSAQVCLSAFDPKHVSLSWYNVLSFHFMQENNPPLAREPSKFDKPPPPYVPKSDKIQQLLEDSSQRLASECQNESPEVPVAVLKEESSDESTIISSQTSTLTRSRGPSEMDEEQEEEEEETEEEVVEEEEEVIVDQSTIKQCQTPMLQALLNEQAMYGTLIPRSASDLSTIDKETNTDSRSAKPGVTPIRRSQTFSPVTKANEYVCKLTRSDSDSSVSTHKRNVSSFQRNTIDRRSVRLKKPQRHSLSPSVLDPRVSRTSIDLELDLQASEVRLSQLNEDITRLEELKAKLEHAKSTGQMEPEWLCNNEQLQHYLAQTDALLKSKEKKRSRGLEERAERLMHRVTRDAKKMRQASVPDVHAFREKMAFFTKMGVSVPAIPSENAVVEESNS